VNLVKTLLANASGQYLRLGAFFAFLYFFNVGSYNSVVAAIPPNTPVINVVTATYSVSGKALSVSATSAVNTASRTPATVSFLGAVPAGYQGAQGTAVNAGACLVGGNNWQAQQNIQSAFAGAISLPNVVNTVASNTFSGRDVAIVALTDFDQNRDPLLVEKVTVEVISGNDKETLQLSESGPSTGYFVGYVQLTRQSSSQGDCRLGVGLNETIRARYTDVNDSTDSVNAGALVDPYGLVFNSLNGDPVNGAIVTILNVLTGQPAVVFGDDGVSSYPSTYTTGNPVTDSSGVVYSLGAGRYRFPLVAPGVYRLAVLPPDGFSFPSKALDSSVKALINDASLGPAAKGESFPVPLGPAVKIDVPLDPRLGKLLVNKTTSRAQASIGDLVRYEIIVRNSDSAPVSNVIVYDVFPKGMRLRSGSLRDSTKGTAINATLSSDGRTMTAPIGVLAANGSQTMSYVLEVTAGTPLLPAVNEAYAKGAGTSSNTASATVKIVDEMLLSRSIILGTVFEGGCPASNEENGKPTNSLTGVKGARILLQDGRFSNTDVDGKWHIEGVQPGTNMVRLDNLSLPSGQKVLACNNDPRRSAANMARTIDVRPGSLNRVDFYTEKLVGSPTTSNATTSTQANKSSANKSTVELLLDAEQVVWKRDNLKPVWAYPKEGSVASESYQSFMVAHAEGQRVELEHQGRPVPGFHFEGTRVGPAIAELGKMATTLWRNVHLTNGENRFVAKIFDANNQLVGEISQILHLATAPVRVELVPSQSKLLANGRDSAVLAIRLFDAKDQPVRKDITGEFSLNSPYVVKSIADALAKNPLASATGNSPRYVVGSDGIAHITLAPTTNSGEVELLFNFGLGRTQTVRAWLQADQREWIVVGFAETSPTSKKLSEALNNASGITADPAEIHGSRIALYAKGTIPGDALLTMAYDNTKRPTAVGASPQAVAVAPFYTVYSDQSQGGIETPSKGRLYVKIEKLTFIALLGNANSGLNSSELGRYAKSMYGLKSSWQGEKFSYTAFAMQNLTSFHRDLFRADGTTGSWKLSRPSVVPFTDRVRVLTRDRLDAGSILNERILTRVADYTVDYISGQLFLAQPIASFDIALNPVTIEVEYSTENLSNDSHTIGGRAAFKPNQNVEVGLTLVNDSDAARGGKLGALDAKVKLGETTTARFEVGKSSRQDVSGTLKGDAVLAEVRHDTADLSARAYYRKTGSFYGLNEQPVSTADLQTVGADIRFKYTPTIRLESQISHQERLSTGQQADVVQARVTYLENAWHSSLGLRLGQEKDGHGLTTQLAQVLASVGYLSPDQKWALRAGAELGENRGAAIFPNRLTFEGDYRISSTLSLVASQSWTFADIRSSALSAGLKYRPWLGAEFQTGISHRQWNDGDNTVIKGSLLQTKKIDDAWTVNAQLTTARRIAGNQFTAASNTGLVPSVSVGSSSMDDFSTMGATLSYASEPWNGYARFEKRWATDRRDVLAGGISRKISDGVHMLATARLAQFAGDTQPSAQISLAHAVRHFASPWTLLSRLDWIDNNHLGNSFGTSPFSSTSSSVANTGQATNSSTISSQFGKRALLSMHWNYLDRSGFEWLNHIGYKRVLESIDAQAYGTSFSVVSTEIRQSLNTYLDIGANAAYAASFSSGVSNASYGISVGVKPMDNTLVVIGYNFRGIKDTDFYGSNQHAQGFRIWLRILLDERLLGLSRPVASAFSQGVR
jgi:uncharacterized repeat protein (TIGR01451 family)